MGKEDRIKKRIKKKETKLKSLTPKAGGGKSSTSSMFTVTNVSKGNKGRTKVDACGSAAQKRGSKNCSKVAKGKKFSTKGSTNTVGNLRKRKRIQNKIDKLKSKVKGSPTKKYANPRFL